MCSDILAAGMHVVCSILINCHVLFKLPEKWFWRWAPFQAQASSSYSVPTVMTLSPEERISVGWKLNAASGWIVPSPSRRLCCCLPWYKVHIMGTASWGIFPRRGHSACFSLSIRGSSRLLSPEFSSHSSWMLCLLTFHSICWFNLLFLLAPYLRNLLI